MLYFERELSKCEAVSIVGVSKLKPPQPKTTRSIAQWYWISYAYAFEEFIWSHLANYATLCVDFFVLVFLKDSLKYSFLIKPAQKIDCFESKGGLKKCSKELMRC